MTDVCAPGPDLPGVSSSQRGVFLSHHCIVLTQQGPFDYEGFSRESLPYSIKHLEAIE